MESLHPVLWTIDPCCFTAPLPFTWGFCDSSVGKESACNAGDLGLIPGSGRSPGEKVGYPLQYSWASLVAQLVKNLPAMQETWVQSLGREDPWRRERLPTPVFRPGEFHGLYSPWGLKELDTTERLSLHVTSSMDQSQFPTTSTSSGASQVAQW